MADYSVRCECGKETVVSEWAIGAPFNCKSCGRPLEATDSNTRPVEERPHAPKPKPESDLPMSPEGRLYARRSANAPTTGPKPKPPARTPVPRPPAAGPVVMASEPESEPVAPEPPRPTTCARCGRAFRGDWDRYRRGEGVVCHICANLAPDKLDPVETVPEAPRESLDPVDYKGALDNPNLPHVELSPEDREAWTANIRRWVIVAAVVTLLMVFIVLATDESNIPPPDVNAVAEAPPELPAWAAASILLTIFVSRVAGLLTALYILLNWKDRLPSDHFFVNLVSLGVWAGGLELLHIIMSIHPLGSILWIGLCIYIFWDQFDLDFTDFLMLGLFLFLLEPVTYVFRAVAGSIIGYFVL